MSDKFGQLQARIEADNSLVEKLFGFDNADAVQEFLKTEGLDFTLEEINTLRDGIVKAAESGNGELSDDDLEDVAGGIAVTVAGVTAVIGAVCAIGSATFAAGNFVNNVTRGRW